LTTPKYEQRPIYHKYRFDSNQDRMEFITH